MYKKRIRCDLLSCIDADCLPSPFGNANPARLIQGYLECHAPNQEAYLADHFSCFLFQMPYFLKKIEFGYITLALVLLVILISLFGRIRLHYRWFILNLSIIDLIICLDFMFRNPNSSDGYFGFAVLEQYLQASDILCKIPSIGLFILTGSRFLNVYLPHVYKKLTQTWKVVSGKGTPVSQMQI